MTSQLRHLLLASLLCFMWSCSNANMQGGGKSGDGAVRGSGQNALVKGGGTEDGTDKLDGGNLDGKNNDGDGFDDAGGDGDSDGDGHNDGDNDGDNDGEDDDYGVDDGGGEDDDGGDEGTSMTDCVLKDSKKIITFENNSVRNKKIGTQYLESHGVSFKLENGALPILAQVNKAKVAFKNNPRAWRCGGCKSVAPINSTEDSETLDIIGNYVLTQPEVTHSKTPPALIVSYKSPTAAASGYLVDIDGGERWVITPLNKSGEPITGAEWSYTGDPGGKAVGNGIARKWTISRSKKDIYALKVSGVKNYKYFGFAFDRFSPSKRICK